jgi:DNA helicase-2/ATP-dependent DNA helicase PcrA
MADGADPLAGLNDAQRRAAQAVRGPVAILAGAGTGKTTTITHRIAHQVRVGAFEPSQVLAVTFTEKAAGSLKSRLAGLGVQGVEARTFHASALRQLGTLWPRFTGRDLPEILNAKAQILNPIANGLPGAYRFLPRRELAGEIEWAKNRLVNPAGYLVPVARQRRSAGQQLLLPGPGGLLLQRKAAAAPTGFLQVSDRYRTDSRVTGDPHGRQGGE